MCSQCREGPENFIQIGIPAVVPPTVIAPNVNTSPPRGRRLPRLNYADYKIQFSTYLRDIHQIIDTRNLSRSEYKRLQREWQRTLT